MVTKQRRALVVGSGIAGMAAALGLRDAGWETLVVERAPGRRTGGYFVGLFPEGKEAATELGVLSGLHTRNPQSGVDWQLDAQGSRKESIGFLDQPGEPYAVMRGDIEDTLWKGLNSQGLTDEGKCAVELRFETSPLDIVNLADCVKVTFKSGSSEELKEEFFDLVVGADGVRSTVRRIIFGSDKQFLKSWRTIICAFELQEQVPGFGPEDGVTLALPRRACWVFPFSDRPPTALLTYRTNDVDAQFRSRADEVLEKEFNGLRSHAVVDHALKSLKTAPHHLFDSVQSVHMPNWRKGRVVLLGDAAWCLTLFSGMGSTAALRGGSELAKSLQAHPDDLDSGLEMWEASMRPFIATAHRRARLLQHMFVPTGPVSFRVRNAAMALLGRASRARRRQ